jgi:hypothetical protein
MRIAADDFRHLPLQLGHRVERDVLLGFGEDEQLPDVVAGQEAFRHIDEQRTGRHEKKREAHHRQPAMG